MVYATPSLYYAVEDMLKMANYYGYKCPGVKVNSKTKLDGTIMRFRITQKNSYMG